MAKTLAQIEAALKERYSGNTYEKKGMTYAAWEDITYAANEVFGPLGWSREFVKTPYREGDGFACILRVTVYFTDEDGTLRSIPFEAPGYNELTLTNAGVEQTDTAFKGAYADALKKVLQALGDAFGLFIGSEAKAAKGGNKNTGSTQQQHTQSTAAPRQSSGNGEGKPTANMVNVLRRAGATDADLDGLTFEAASRLIDQVKANGWKMPGAPTRNETTAARVGSPDDEVENIFA